MPNTRHLHNTLPAYRVTYDDGMKNVTSCAENVTLEMAKKYFLGQQFEQADEVTILTVVKVEPFFSVGDYAQSIETGWIGKIQAFEELGGPPQTLARMIGVDTLVQLVAGLNEEQCLAENDIQWFSPNDLKFYPTKTRLIPFYE